MTERPDHIIDMDGDTVHVDYYTDGSIGLWTSTPSEFEIHVSEEQLESILPKLEG